MNIGLPEALTAGPDGAVWYTVSGVPRALHRITAAGQLNTYELPDAGTVDWMRGIAAGPDHALWFTESELGSGGPPDAIARLTVDGKFSRWPLPQRRGEPTRIISGPDRDLWFTEHAGHRIGRISTSGHITQYVLPPGVEPDGITSTADGMVWFTSAHKVGRVSPGGKISEWRIAGSGLLSDIAPGPDHGLWLADSEDDEIRYFRPDG